MKRRTQRSKKRQERKASKTEPKTSKYAEKVKTRRQGADNGQETSEQSI